jgi:hypothetical protein
MYVHVHNYVRRGYRRVYIVCTKTYIICKKMWIIRHKFVNNDVHHMWRILQGGTVIALQMQLTVLDYLAGYTYIVLTVEVLTSVPTKACRAGKP